jgi:photosystem II stability/assembly factor-like uncharacterized protein
MKTTDAGTTWVFNHLAGGPFGTSGQKTNNYDAWFFNQNTGFIASSSGYIIRTTNGGTSFDTLGSGTTASIYSIAFTNTNTGYACGTTSAKILKTTNGGNNWTVDNTPPWTVSGYYLCVADTATVYVACSNGSVYKTTNGGTNWTLQTTGATSAIYKINFLNVNTGYLCGASGLCRMTTDGGTTWNAANTGLPATTFNDIDFRLTSMPPTNKLYQNFQGTYPPTGWTVNNPTYLFKSTNCGGYGLDTASSEYNFYNAPAGTQLDLTTVSFTATIAGDSLSFDHAYATYVSEIDSLSIWTSTNGGTNFTNLVYLPGGVSGPLVTAPPSSSQFVPTPAQWATKRYALPVGTNMLRFKGHSQYGNNCYLDNIKVSSPASVGISVLLTGDSFNLYKTTNNGTSWDTLGFLGSPQPWTSSYYSADYIGASDTIVTVGAYGLINRRQGPSSKQCFTTLIKTGANYDVWAQSATGNVLTVGASTIAGTVYDQILKSTNGGVNWSIVPYSTTSRTQFNSLFMIDANTGYACGTLSAVYRTTNGGSNWDSVSIPNMQPGLNLSKVFFINSSTGWVFSRTIVAADTTTIFKTTNAGVNWTGQRIAGAVGTANYVYGAYMVDANTGWLVNYTPRPYITTDGGATWTVQTLVDAFGGFLYDIKMLNANTGFIAGSSGRLYKTINGGTNWDTISVPTRSYSFNSLEVTSASNLLIAGATGVTMSSSNGGTSWALLNTSGSTLNGTYMFPDGKAFTVGSSGYIFRNLNTLVGTGENTTGIPNTYQLLQNYPNPFNPSTNIKFALPKAGMVTIKIYDMVGREITKLLNNQYYPAGWQNIIFNGSNLASGVYFYQLTVDENLISTKKMILVK